MSGATAVEPGEAPAVPDPFPPVRVADARRLRRPPIGARVRDVLLEIARPAFDPASAGAAVDLLEETDWPAVLGLARAHGLLPALALALDAASRPDAAPRDARAFLRRTRVEALSSDRVQLLVLGELLDALRAKGVPAIVLKGQSIAERLHRDPSARVSRDIDLLVRPGDLEAAGEALGARGFQAVQPTFYRDRHFHVPWVHRSRTIGERVELHWDVTLPDSAVRFDVSGWFDRARTLRMRGGPALVPPAADEVAYVAHHAVQGGAARVRELGDVAGLFAMLGRSGADDLAHAAARARSAGALAVTLRAARACWPDLVTGTERFPIGGARRHRALARVLWDRDRVLHDGDRRWWALCRVAQWTLDPGHVPIGALLDSTEREVEAPWLGREPVGRARALAIVGWAFLKTGCVALRES